MSDSPSPSLTRRDFLSTSAKLGAFIAAAPYIARGADALRLYAAGQSPATIKPDGGDGYIGEIRHFIESIQAGRAPTLVTPADAALSIEVCEAEERSALNGETIVLS